MTPAIRRFGLSAAISTPFTKAFAPDRARLAAHAKRLLGEGCDSVTLCGTTGEGASLSLGARATMLEAMRDIGADMVKQVVMGVAAAPIEDAIAQGRQGLQAGCRALLLAPPFYFKGVSDEALFAWFAKAIEGFGAEARVILYHIPSVTAVGLSAALIGRLKQAFGDAILGVKDSSGDWSNTAKLLEAHGDLAILVGDERQLGAAVRGGGAGSICGLANFAPAAAKRLIETGKDDPAITGFVNTIVTFPVMAAVKALVAMRMGDPEWRRMAPPLDDLPTADVARIEAAFTAHFAAKAA